MMRPLEEFSFGHVMAWRSLLLKYTSLPPQLVSWRALRAGHFSLAALAAVAVMANILTVALGGLFTQTLISRARDAHFMQTYEHQFSPGFGQNFSLALSQYSQFGASMLLQPTSPGNLLYHHGHHHLR